MQSKLTAEGTEELGLRSPTVREGHDALAHARASDTMIH